MIEQEHFKASPLAFPCLRPVLLDFKPLHEWNELKEKARQAEHEVDGFMDNEGSPCGNLELGVVVQHVDPGMFKWSL